VASGVIWTLGGGTIADDGKPYYCTYNDWTLARYRVNGVWKFTLWKGKGMVGFYDSVEAANTTVHETETK
jgi:hypothetical protein